MSTTPQQMQQMLALARTGSSLMGSPGLSQGLGDASSGLNIYGDLQQGTPQGDLNAVAQAGKLYGNLASDPGISQYAGDLAGGLNIYGGIQQGGVAGDTRAALGAYNLYNTAGSLAGTEAASAAGSALSALGQYVPVIGTLLGAYLDTQTPAYTMSPKFYQGLADTLAKGPGVGEQASYSGDSLEGLQYGNYVSRLLGAETEGDPIEKSILKAYGYAPNTSTLGGMSYPEINQMIGHPLSSNGGQRGRMAQGGPVKRYYDDGGGVDYFQPTIPADYSGDYISSQYGASPVDYSNLIAPNNTQQGLQDYLNQNTPATGYDVNGNQFNVNENANPVPSGLQEGSNPAFQVPTGIPGLGGGANSSGGGGLSGLLSNPGALGALLGGVLGLGGALGSRNGQNTMLANYNPHPPQMFNGSGPSAANMYGNFSADPRTRLHPTNINYATAGQNPTPGGNMFYSPSGGPPTAPMSQSSPLQQYGAQQATPQQAGMNPNQLSVPQLIQLLQGQNMTAGQGMTAGGMSRSGLHLEARGGSIEQGPLSMGMNPHMTSATAGGPSHIDGPGGGQDDQVDARLSPGEFVMDAHSVSMLGDGSNEEGARKLEQLRTNLRKHAAKSMAKGKQFMGAKAPMAYVGGQAKS